MASVDFSPVRALVVDDSRFMARAVERMLKQFGVRDVSVAHSGREAMHVFGTVGHDLVISDWDMEDSDGEDLVRFIRHDRASPNPMADVIMLTGFAELRRVLRARDFGITEFLTKPVSAEAMYARMVHMVTNPRPFIRVPGGYFGPDRRRAGRSGYTGPERRSQLSLVEI